MRTPTTLRQAVARLEGALTSRPAGVAVNLLLRASIAGFLVDVLLHPDDPRYKGKAIPIRNFVVVGSLSFAFPLLHVLRARRGRRQPYPFWPDALYLSIFWLDMAGNAFNLYDRYTHFDLIPHFHGTGALAAVLPPAFGWSPARAVLVTNGIHALLEAQEYATDVFFGTHNVRGAWDSGGDLSAGLLGTLVYSGAPAVWRALSPAERG